MYYAHFPLFILSAITTALAVIIFTPVNASAYNYPRAENPLPQCGLSLSPKFYQAVKRDLPAVDFDNKDHSWMAVQPYNTTRVYLMYSETIKIQLRPATSTTYAATIHPLDGKQHFVQYYYTDATFSAPVSTESPVTYYPSQRISCYFAAQGLVYAPDYFGSKWVEVNDNQTPPSDGGSDSGLTPEMLDSSLHKAIGVLVALVIAGYVVYQFRYKGAD